MKRILVISILLAGFCSCGAPKQEDPVHEAIKAQVAAQLGELRSFSWESFEQVESTTFGNEIERRRTTIETRRKQNLKLAAGYKASGKANNAAKKESEAAKDAIVLEGIAAIESRLAAADSLDVTELVVYRFSAKAKTADGASSEIKDMYVAMTPDNKVFSMDYTKGNMYRTSGKLLPGYSALLAE